MSVRDSYQWGPGTTSERVEVGKLKAIRVAFGSTRLLGASTPEQEVDKELGGLRFDFPFSRFLRVCFVAKRLPIGTPALPGVVQINAHTTNEQGGISTDYSFLGDPREGWIDPGVGYEADTNPPPVSGHEIKLWGAADGGDPTTEEPFVEQLVWAQLTLRVPGDVQIVQQDGFRKVAPPGKNKLNLEFWQWGSNIDYLKNVMVYEWTRHPQTPTQTYTNQLNQTITQFKSDHSFGMGSKYDIFTGD